MHPVLPCMILLLCCCLSLAAEDAAPGGVPVGDSFDIMQILDAMPQPEDLREAAAIVDQGFGELLREQDRSVQSVRNGLADDPDDPLTALGVGGTLWCFWAIDAPHARSLAPALGRLSGELPEVRVREVHVLPLQNWVGFMREANKVKQDILSAGYHGESRKAQMLSNRFRTRYASLHDMPHLFGRRTQPVFNEVKAAIHFGITDFPSFIYISPRGLLHRLVGAGASLSLSEWIGRCLDWEQHQEDDQ